MILQAFKQEPAPDLQVPEALPNVALLLRRYGFISQLAIAVLPPEVV
jgi:hypothetical protein